MCDWCEGGAADLVIGENVQADVDIEDGMMRVYIDGKEAASRKVNYCPMCGGRVGVWVDTFLI